MRVHGTRGSTGGPSWRPASISGGTSSGPAQLPWPAVVQWVETGKQLLSSSAVQNTAFSLRLWEDREFQLAGNSLQTDDLEC